MTLNRLLTFFLLIGSLGCQHQSDQPPVIATQNSSCDCPFLNDKPNYTINQNPDSLTQYYLDIWKRKFIERHGIDQTQFTAQIKDLGASLFSWQDGVSLRVDYYYQQDWLRVRRSESMQILYNLQYTKDYAIDVPRGVYLTESQIIFRLPWNDVQPLHLSSKLAFASCEAACQALKTKTGYSMLSPNYVSFYPSATLPNTPSGDPYMFSAGTIDLAANRCVFGRINLLTGEVQANEGPCWIH